MTEERQPADYGTAELSRRHQLKPELTGKGYSVRLRVTDAMLIDRLLSAGKMTADLHSAAESILGIMNAARMIGVAATDWNRSTRSDPTDISKSRSDALLKLMLLQRHLAKAVGKADSRLMFRVLLEVEAPASGPRLSAFLGALQASQRWLDEWHGLRAPSGLELALAAL